MKTKHKNKWNYIVKEMNIFIKRWIQFRFVDDLAFPSNMLTTIFLIE